MNEFTSFVILNYFSSSVVQNPTCSMGLLMCSCVLAFACPLFFGMMHGFYVNCWNKVWYVLHPNIYVVKYCHG